MKEILLPKGRIALVDDEDFERLNRYKWYAHGSPNKPLYAVRTTKINGRMAMISMHSEIITIPPGLITDHIDLNSLNNQKSNLRAVTYRTSNRNTSRNKGVVGVTRQGGKWQAQISIEGRNRYLGVFERIEDASAAHSVAEKCLIGD
jgi:hypothetical protein